MNHKSCICQRACVVAALLAAMSPESPSQAATLTNEIVKSHLAPPRGWNDPVFDFPRFDENVGVLQSIELEYSALVSAGDFVVANSSSRGQFITIHFTNLFTLTPPNLQIRRGGFVPACGYSSARSRDVFITPDPMTAFIRTGITPISGSNLTNYTGSGTVGMRMMWDAAFNVYRRDVLDCSRLFEKPPGVSAGDTTFQLSATVTLRYIYVPTPIEQPKDIRITSFLIQPGERKATLSWLGVNVIGHTFVVEAIDLDGSPTWSPRRTNTPTSSITVVPDLEIDQSSQLIYRIRLQ